MAAIGFIETPQNEEYKIDQMSVASLGGAHLRNRRGFSFERVTNTWADYLREITGDDRGVAIARRLGVSDSKVSYWKRGDRPPTVSEAIRAAREYGRPPLEGLVAAGYLDEEELPEHLVVQQKSLRAFTDAELAAELLRRAESVR